jgi:hypothetical protein
VASVQSGRRTGRPAFRLEGSIARITGTLDADIKRTILRKPAGWSLHEPNDYRIRIDMSYSAFIICNSLPINVKQC